MDPAVAAENGNYRAVAKWMLFHPIGTIAMVIVAVMGFIFVRFADDRV